MTEGNNIKTYKNTDCGNKIDNTRERERKKAKAKIEQPNLFTLNLKLLKISTDLQTALTP
jgi:hypothetical protein